MIVIINLCILKEMIKPFSNYIMIILFQLLTLSLINNI